MPARIVISVILEVEPVIFFAAAAENLDMPRRICHRRQRLGFLPQGIGPEMPIELAVAEMICLFDKYWKQPNCIPQLLTSRQSFPNTSPCMVLCKHLQL